MRCLVHETAAPAHGLAFCTCRLGAALQPDSEWQLVNGATGKSYGEHYPMYYRRTLIDAIDAEIAALPDAADHPEDEAFLRGRGYALALFKRRIVGEIDVPK